MKISDIAERCSINVQTIRFYERRGLLRDPRAGANGYRDYDEGDVDRLTFIRQAQTLGFTLKEVAELVALRDRRGSASDVRVHASAKLAAVRAKIATLRRLERTLVELVASCPGRGGVDACPILQEIARRDPGQSPERALARRKRSR